MTEFTEVDDVSEVAQYVSTEWSMQAYVIHFNLPKSADDALIGRLHSTTRAQVDGGERFTIHIPAVDSKDQPHVPLRIGPAVETAVAEFLLRLAS